MTSIAVLVVSYHSSDELVEFVPSILGAVDEQDELSIHVIENSGDPAELDGIRDLAGVVTTLASPDNLGYGGGMNRLAADLADDVDWLLICNPDVRFVDGAVSHLVRVAEQRPEAALFGPQILDEDGQRYPSARRFPSLRTGAGHAVFGRIWPSNPWTRRYHHLSGPDAPESSVDWLSGACLLARPSAYRQIGGFDESYFMYFEDVDLALRLRKAGWDVVYSPAATVIHSGGHSTSGQSQLMRRVHHDSAKRYVRRRYAAWYLAPVRWVVVAGLNLRQRFGRG